jgi:hypothetical protein
MKPNINENLELVWNNLKEIQIFPSIIVFHEVKLRRKMKQSTRDFNIKRGKTR